MSVTEVAADVVQATTGVVRDAVRTGVLAGLRARGHSTGRLLDPHMVVDPYPTYDWIRAQGPAFQAEMGIVTASHDVCGAVLRSPSVITATSVRDTHMDGTSPLMRWLFGNPDRSGLIDPLGPDTMVGTDGADHARLRSVVSAVFTPNAVSALRPRLEEIAAELVDETARQQTFDLMTSLAGPLPVRAICEVLGVPTRDVDRFARWGSDIAADLDSLVPAHRQRAATRSLRDLKAYFEELVPARHRTPGDDILSRLITAEAQEGRLSEREIVATAILLLFAGFETTVNLIGNGAAALLRHPEQLRLLQEDPTRIPRAVEEMLRYDAPVQLVGRIPTTDLCLASADLPEGVMISLMIGGANRDPAVFEDPGRFDVLRPNAAKHLSFAAGPHHCLGASLARMEAQIAFTALLERFEHLELAGTPRRRKTFILRGYRSIPVRGSAPARR